MTMRRSILKDIHRSNPTEAEISKRPGYGKVISFAGGMVEVDTGAVLPDGNTVYLKVPAAEGFTPEVGQSVAILYPNTSSQSGYAVSPGSAAGAATPSGDHTVFQHNGGFGGLSAYGSANQVLGMNAGASAFEYKTVTGTANQVTVTHGVGSITLSLPQNIHTAATPQFGGLGIGAAYSAGKTVKIAGAAGDTHLLEADGTAYAGAGSRYGVYTITRLAAGCTGVGYGIYAGVIDDTAISSAVSRSRYAHYNNLTIQSPISGSGIATYAGYGLTNFIVFSTGAADTSSVNQTITTRAIRNELSSQILVINKSGGTLAWTNYMVDSVMDDYDIGAAWVAGAVSLTNVGYNIEIPMGNQIALDDITLANYGGRALISGTHGGGSAACVNYGWYADVANGSANWSFYAAAGDWAAAADNQKFFFGAGQDASIYYDSSDLIINSDDVGTGACIINGMSVRADGTILLVSMADASAPNSSLYYSTTASRPVWKDSGGVVNNLY